MATDSSKTVRTKTDMVKHLADQTDITQTTASRVLDVLADYIVEALAQGDDVRIANIGTLGVMETQERTGRNPLTGQPMTIKASRRVRFRVAKLLKDRLTSQ